MTALSTNLVLTVDEAAAVLRVSRGLAFAAVRAGTIPHVRIGRRILIPRAALYEMLGTAAVLTLADSRAQAQRACEAAPEGSALRTAGGWTRAGIGVECLHRPPGGRTPDS